jgi:hypothetical protein
MISANVRGFCRASREGLSPPRISIRGINMPIEGKVVHVDRTSRPPGEIVVNVGSEHGISMLSTFLIYVLSDEILDPDTGASLGRLEKVHGRGRAKHVQPRMTTVVPTTRTRQVTRKLYFNSPEVTQEEEEVPFDANIDVGDLSPRV